MKPLRLLVFLSLLVCASVTRLFSNDGSPRILDITPQSQSMASLEDLEIIVDFDTPVDPASLSSTSFAVFGRWTGVCPGEFQLENANRRIRFTPNKSFSAGEWITVSLSKEIHNDTGETLAQGYAWNFWMAAGRGSLELQRTLTVPVREKNEGQIRAYGAYAGDLNGDGFHDFTVPNEDASDIRVFLNDGFGRYTNYQRYPLPSFSFPSTNEGADFNGDGHIDFAVGSIGRGTVSVLFGIGDGRFLEPTQYQVGSQTRGLAVLDLNGDGYTDIVAANRLSSDLGILLNKGDGSFHEAVSFETGLHGETSCAVADANGDGLLDVFVGGFESQQIAVLLSNGDGSLTVSSIASARGDAWMIALGDMDGDGHVDVVSANARADEFALLKGDGTGRLEAGIIFDTGRFPLAIDVGDLDGDGDLEVITSNFMSSDWILFENNGRGQFRNPRRLPASDAGSCAVFHDRDRDGDLDVTGIDEVADQLVLFENSGPTDVQDDVAADVPLNFELQQSYPNPFSRSGAGSSRLVIPFLVKQPEQISLELFNIRGQKIAEIVSGRMPAGEHRVTLETDDLPMGLYFYRLSAPTFQITRKFVVFP